MSEITNRVATLMYLLIGFALINIPWLNINNTFIDIAKIDLIIKLIVVTIGIIFVVIGILYLKKDFKTENKNYNDDILKHTIKDTRQTIIDNNKPDLYLPLENTFCDIATNLNCNTNIFPHIFVQGDTFENNPFVKNFGYKFNGKNMISAHMKESLPSAKEARTFIFAIKPTDRPTDKNPMFFFSYGQRKSHKCNDGINNHDKSFGIFWGEPQPDESIDEKFKGLGVRVFFYCEHCKKDRNSKNCDTPVLYNINELNRWYILAVTYSGDKIDFYLDGTKIHSEEYDINTSNTPYLNIGGFVHHDEKGAMITKDLDYTMKGYIREFIMLKRKVSETEINELTKNITKLLI